LANGAIDRSLDLGTGTDTHKSARYSTNASKYQNTCLAALFVNRKNLLGTLGIGAFFLGPIVLQPTGYSITQKAHWVVIENRVFTQETVKSLEKRSELSGM